MRGTESAEGVGLLRSCWLKPWKKLWTQGGLACPLSTNRLPATSWRVGARETGRSGKGAGQGPPGHLRGPRGRLGKGSVISGAPWTNSAPTSLPKTSLIRWKPFHNTIRRENAYTAQAGLRQHLSVSEGENNRPQHP